MGKIGCVAIVKNEERHIAEWLAWQFFVGFDTVFLLNNESTDRTRAIAAGFAPRYDVRVLDWPGSGQGFQGRAYEHAAGLLKDEFEWLAFFDADEFLVLDEGLELKNLLAQRQEAAIGVPWALFGSSGHKDYPQELVIEAFSRRAPANFPPNAHIKSIVRPGKVKRAYNPHAFEIEGEYVDLMGRRLEFHPPGVLTGTAEYDGVKLHHYFTRSWAHWQARLARGNLGSKRTEKDFHNYDRNEIYDDSAARHAPEIKRMLCGILPIMRTESLPSRPAATVEPPGSTLCRPEARGLDTIKMKWFFCWCQDTELRSGHNWKDLIRVAVQSAKLHTALEPHFIYDGEVSAFTDELIAAGVNVIFHRVSFAQSLIDHNPASTQWQAIARGAFLRFDIPLVTESQDELVLYTDADVLFQQDLDFTGYIPPLLAAAPQFNRGSRRDMNSGVMLLNLRVFREIHAELVAFTKANLHLGLDQEVLRVFLGTRYTLLPDIYNWKPYWGVNAEVPIVHWHGPKPETIAGLLNGGISRTSKSWQGLFERNPPAYAHYLALHESYLAQYQAIRAASFAPVEENTLIFDIGMAEGDDTALYLAKGFRVVGLEPSAKTYYGLCERFTAEIKAGRLTVLNYAAGRETGQIVEFFHNDRHPRLSGLSAGRPEFASGFTSYHVVTIGWAELVAQYGVPHYAKIDIEGAEVAFLGGAEGAVLPAYISVECHDLGPAEALYKLGYRRFQLSDQQPPGGYAWSDPPREGQKAEGVDVNHTSGPFGRELPPDWLDFKAFCAAWRGAKAQGKPTWYDCHAALK